MQGSLKKVTAYLLIPACLYWPKPRFISVFDGPEKILGDYHTFALRKFPTISTIINKTMPMENAMILRKWQAKMRKQMGDRGFNEHMTRIKRLGQDVHEAVCDLLAHNKEAFDISSPVDGYIHSLQHILAQVTATHFVEENCSHPILGYRGRFDSINSFQENSGPFVLTEWKTVHESKRVTSLEKAYDAPLQVAAYAGAFNICRLPGVPEVRQGLIAYAYADGYPADVLILSEEHLEHFFQLWCARVEGYNDQLRAAP